MGGFSSVSGDETIMFADNASFNGTQRGGKMTTNGQIWIGSTASPHVKLGLPTGVSANTTPVMQAVYGSGTLAFENRTWQTQYVVDPSSAVGLRGTFTTVQDAINQAIADGTTAPVIYLRKGSYVENITVPSGKSVYIIGPAATPMDSFQNAALAGIVGTATIVGTAYFENVSVNTINHTSSGTTVYAFNSNFLNITSIGTLILDSCIFTSTGSDLSGGTIRIRNCSLLGTGADCISFTGGTASIMENCHGFHPSVAVSVAVTNAASVTFINNSNLTLAGTTTGDIKIQNCSLRAAVNFASATTLSVSDVSFSPQGSGSQLVTQVPTTLYASSQGNVLSRRVVTSNGNVTNNDQYIGCNKAGALSISLVRTNFIKGQVITFKDESGAAAANNITITPSAGTIDGAASFVLNTNYQAINVIFDGTNFFIF